MKNFISKTKMTVAIVLVLLMTSVMLMANVPNVSVKAQVAIQKSVSGPLPAGATPNVTVPTVAYLSFRPNPVGLGQSILINAWITPGSHQGRQQTNYKFTITNPNGTQTVFTIDPEPATNAIWFEWLMDQVGTWKLKFDFPGGYFAQATVPPGFMEMGPQILASAYYMPSSTAEQTLTVQQDMVLSWPPSPIPTDYWTRPVAFENREWWSIMGNWPAAGYDGTYDPEWDTRYPNTNPNGGPDNVYDFTPWVQAPNSAHIVWKRQVAIGGILGGQTGPGYGITPMGAGIFGSIPNLIYAGRMYTPITKAVDGVSKGFLQCYDIRTGQVIWEQPLIQTVSSVFGFTMVTNLQPTVIEYSRGLTTAGSVEGYSATFTVSLMTVSSGYLLKWDPWTGALTTNVSIAPLTGGFGGGFGFAGMQYYKNEWVLAVQDMGSAAGAQRYRLINWTTAGTTSNFTQRIQSNTTYARSSLPSSVDWNVGLGADVVGISKAGAYVQINVTGYNLLTGAKLWSNLVDEPQYSGSCTIADHGKIATLSINGYYLAWDLSSGELAWKSEKMDYPWAQPAFGGYMSASAYGMLFRTAYSGVYAFDWETGKIVWKYEHKADAAFESPYIDANGTEVYSDNTGVEIADGKLYSYHCEHSQTWPRTRGWSTFCINVTTGEEIWSIKMSGTAAFGDTTDIGGIADGYLSLSTADGMQYVFGKGKSATTTTAPETTVPLGTPVLIKGTVLDQSPAQAGTPCVSKESMALQMEYLHLQASIGGLWGNETVIGVPVMLTAYGSDGTVIDIGTVTTNGYYGTFSTAWTPPAEGTYEIVATFVADDSYSSSSAAAALSIGPAPETTPPVNIPTPVDNTNLLYGIMVAVIVAIIISIYAVLRKRP